MAATDVLPSSPMTPGQVAPWTGFDDYLDFPSPINTPRLAPATTAMNGVAQSVAVAAPTVSSAVKPASSAVSSSSHDGNAGPPPPSGSSPETLFRYYLAAELRKMGNPADDATIDRYVAQHCDSFTRAMERSQASAQAAQNAKDEKINGVQPFRSPHATNEPSSSPFVLSAPPKSSESGAASATDSIDPHMVDLRSVQNSLGNIQVASPTGKVDSIANDDSFASRTSPIASTSASLSYRSKSVDDEDDEMSEDEDDQEVSKTAATDKSGKRVRVRAIEETPIEGSIMGPMNELRPDPETYRKLTSKEKRQLRNKISARNFRTRRKEQISHLEQQVVDRDTIIEGLRQQLANVTVQNKDLQEEVRALKTKAISSSDVSRIIEALQKSASSSTSEAASMAPPSLLVRSSSNSSLSDTAMARPPTPSMTSSSPRSMSPRPSVSLGKPNTRKDVPGTSGGATGARSFWGGVGGANGNGFMSVHTVLVPSLFNLSSLPTHQAAMTETKKGVYPPPGTPDIGVLALTERTREMGLEDDAKRTSQFGAKKTDGEMNAALVSLIDGHDNAPPSYTEAIEQSKSQDVESPKSVVPMDRVQDALLRSLNEALSSPTASSSAKEKSSSTSSLEGSQLDPHRLQALLEGRARLALVDEEGRTWQDETISTPLASGSVLQSVSA